MKTTRQAASPPPAPELRESGLPGAGSRADELLDRLEEIFLREGFRRITIGELATRLRCSRRSLYELAAGKNDLFVLVLDRLLRRIDAAGRVAAAQAASYEEKVTAFIEPGIAELRGASAAFFADIAGLTAARDRLAAHQESRMLQLEKIFAAGIRAKAFRKVHAAVAARAMVAAYRAVTDAKFLVGVDVTSTDAVRETENLFLRGLLHPED
jgi:AcrR family transcriptional regulator